MVGMVMLYAILLLLCQDVDQLIQDLGHDRGEIRESATKILINMGKKAIPRLENAMKHSNDVEVWQRSIKILEDINYSIQLDVAINPRGPITLSHVDVPLNMVLKDLAKQTNLDIICPNQTKVTINARGNYLIPILDNVGAQIDKQWSFHRDAVVWSEGFVKSPHTYDKGMKVTLARLDVYKSFDNKEYKSLAWAYLKLYTEPQTKLMGTPSFELSTILIDNEEAPIDSLIQNASPTTMVGTYESSPFTINKNSNIKVLNKLAGQVKMHFAAKYHDVVMDINYEDYITKTDYRSMEFRIVDYGYEGVTSMAVEFSDSWASEQPVMYIGNYVDTTSFVVVEHDGTEYKGEELSIDVRQDNLNTMKYDITIDGKCPYIKTIKFRVVDKVLEHSVPFSFNNIAIP